MHLLRHISAGLLCLGTSFALVQTSAPEVAEAAPACPSNPNHTLSDFPAYKYEITGTHKAALDAIANKVLELTRAGKPVRKIRIVGHAAFYAPDHKTSEGYQKISEQRASVVNAELTARFANLGIKYDKVKIIVEGMSDRCPVDTNSTQAGRAKNRRVEIWIEAAPQAPPKPKAKTRKQLLQSLKASTSNPTTQCIAGKLLSSGTNADYLPVKGLKAFMDARIQDVTTTGYTDFELDLAEQLQKTVKRIHDVPTKQSEEVRFNNAFNSAQRDLIDGVRALKYLDCYDKRTPAVKKHLINRSKQAKSLYSCPVIKQLVKDMTANTCTG
ncbi:MAG: OmpA family protein [Myxococcales bacterium]|nr:OmpA family protein [Myxococcales bacterium]MCB9608293.1 OmpA family protein [Polyangiaceae bacterium]